MECLHFQEGRAREPPPPRAPAAKARGWGAGADRGGTEGAPRSLRSPGILAPAVLPEPLLTRRVPELQLDPFAGFDLQQAGEEVHADRGVAGWGAQPGKAALGEAVQEARLAHGGVPDHYEAELVDPDGLHRSGAPRAPRAAPPSQQLWASLAAGTVPSAPLGCQPAGFQHIPAAAAAAAAWSPPSLEGEAGPSGPGPGGGAGRGRSAGEGETRPPRLL